MLLFKFLAFGGDASSAAAICDDSPAAFWTGVRSQLMLDITLHCTQLPSNFMALIPLQSF